MLNTKKIFNNIVQSRVPAGNKPFYLLLFVFLLSLFQNSLLTAQTNLIYNGDFEMYDTCPTFTSSPGDDQVRFCLGWKSATYGTSDYYNVCASGSNVGVPFNMGFQWPFSGNAYCGVLVQYYAQGTPANNGWWVEYIQSKLTSRLKSGKEYEFSCRLSLSTNEWGYAFWKFGAYFSQFPVTKTDAKPFDGITPQVMNTVNNFITDTLNWIEIKGKFIAQGTEEYITLGFYIDTLAPDTLRLQTVSGIDPTNNGAYYYIDGCNVLETGIAYEYPNIFSPNGDGENDEWKPFIKEDEIIEIYNRWGIKIYEISNERQMWDGKTTAGHICTDGVYYYVAKSKDKIDNIKKGFIQLVR